MNLDDFLDYELFELFGRQITSGRLLLALLTIVATVLLYWFLVRNWLPRYFKREKVKTANHRNVTRAIRFTLYLLALIGLILSLGLDMVIHETVNYTIRLTNLLEALLIIQFAYTLDWIISKVLLYNYYSLREQDETEGPKNGQIDATRQPASRLVQATVYTLAAIFIISNFDLDYRLVELDSITIRVSGIAYSLLIFLLARLFIWVLVNLVLFNYYRRKDVDTGSRYAFNQLLKYVVYIFAAFLILESVGIQMTVIWGGAAALLVGVGLGLQQTFNDLLSGVLLLFERTVEVGDMVQIEGLIGTVRKIGLRTSLVETNDNVAVIVPNSKLITEKVINWSHVDDKVRFRISIGVAYGSDTKLVRELLTQVATENLYVMDKPRPTVRFIGFGDSSLDFQLLFWSRNFIVIEDIKSDLRFAIDEAFRKNGVEIPFPQRDVWIKQPKQE
ncbi:MAG: mechanosensitive ion channel domain-containing protein [Bacteroidota bacterium]